MIIYTDTLDGITENMLIGFFEKWPCPLSSKQHLQLLKNSDFFYLAIDVNHNKVVGYVTAITDRVLSAYIPFLEVLPQYRKQGIGSKLVEQILTKKLNNLYMVDLTCDDNLISFYSKFKMIKSTAMTIRKYQFQAGVADVDN